MDDNSEHTAHVVPNENPSNPRTTSTAGGRKALRLRHRRPALLHSASFSDFAEEDPELERLQQTPRRSTVKPEASRTRGGPQSGSSRVRTPAMPRQSSSTMDPPPLTRTGRPKKALKGVHGAHPCACGRSYSRAEHLRRHQKNHTENLRCNQPGCEKRVFHRPDLLQRHQASHNSTNIERRRDSRLGSKSDDDVPNTIASVTPGSNNNPSFIPLSNSTAIDQSYQLSSHFDIDLLETPKSRPSVAADVPFSSIPHFQLHPLITTISQPNPPITFRDTFVDHTLAYDSSSSGRTSPHPALEVPYLNPHLDFSGYRPRNGSDASSEWAYPNYPSSSISPISMGSGSAALFDQSDIPGMGTSEPAAQAFLSISEDASFVFERNNTPLLSNDSASSSRMMDHQLLPNIGIDAQRNYVEKYWQSFHPLFPVVHKPTFLRNDTSTVVAMAMMTIGAHLVGTAVSQQHARWFYECCQKQLALQTSANEHETSTLQAIFLTEAFSQYKTRRASHGLSERFLQMYESLVSKRSITDRESVDDLANITPTSDDRRVYQQWANWTDTHVQQRLLLAAYVLEAQQAILLARETVSNMTSEIDLPIPTQNSLWEAEDARSWANIIHAGAPPTIYVREVLEDPTTIVPGVLDTFQSSVLIAAYDNLFFSSTMLTPTSPFLGPFGQLTQASSFLPLLATDSATQSYYYISEVVHNAPRRALLAVSGESWVYSSRLSSDAAQAKAEFAALKLELRKWSDESELAGQGPAEEAEEQPRRQALASALRVLSLAANRVNAPHEPWLYGGEIAVYLSTLVLWSVCSRAMQRQQVYSFALLDIPSVEEAAFPSQTSLVDFLRRAEADVAARGVVKNQYCKEGVRSVIMSTKALLRGNETDEKQLGELLQGCVGVLDKLRRRGWDETWF